MTIEMNWPAIAVAGLAAFMLGSLWFSSALFGKPWMRAMGITLNDIHDAEKPIGPALAASLASSLVMSLVMAVLLALTGIESLSGGLGIGALVFFGFNGASFFRLVFWEDRPVVLFLISAGYDLMCFMLAGGVLAIWR